MGVVEVVDHNVKCGQEGVHVEHEGSVPFPWGSGSRPTLERGHLPLKSSIDNSHQAFKGWPKLREELLNFRRKQNKVTAHSSYEHWRESDHDDLVLAAALACWKATYKRKGTTRLKVLY